MYINIITEASRWRRVLRIKAYHHPSHHHHFTGFVFSWFRKQRKLKAAMHEYNFELTLAASDVDVDRPIQLS
jgi:hypothetical protein